MDFTVGYVSKNLVTQKIFVEFQDSQIISIFGASRCPMDPKNEIFDEKNLESEKGISKVHFKIN